jgi:ABC-type branched-subunit amino acid transport system ATPase component
MRDILTATDVQVVFGGLKAVAGMNLAVSEGMVSAIIGPNGAGKTTFFNTISGHQHANAGRVVFRGADVTGAPPDSRARMGMARTFQTGGLIPDLTVFENVILGADLASRGARSGERAATAATAMSHMEQFGITRHRQALAGKLPAGTRRLVEVARAVASEASLILLDEPAVGLSEAERDHLGRVIRDLAASGTAFIITDHVTDFLFAVADQVTAMNFGQLLASGSPSEVRSDPRVADAYLGRRASEGSS